jgi:hypothetical protein
MVLPVTCFTSYLCIRVIIKKQKCPLRRLQIDFEDTGQLKLKRYPLTFSIDGNGGNLIKK